MNELDYMKAQMAEQSNLQSEASEQQARLYAPQLKEQLSEIQAAVIYQTNPIRALRVLVEGFRGNIINENNEVEAIGESIMNNVGIARISTMIIPFISDPIRFGNISAREVRLLALQITNDLTIEIGIHWRDYGVKHPAMKDMIIDSLMTLIFITLTRSEEGNEKNFLGKIVLESIGNQKKQSKGGGLWEKYLKL